jgi:Protein of unknown function (DUF4230)
VDLGGLGEDAVEVRDDTVTIRLPEPEVFSASLDEDKTRVYDRNYAPLNLRPNDDLVEGARATAEGRIEAAVRAFVSALGHKEVCFK